MIISPSSVTFCQLKEPRFGNGYSNRNYRLLMNRLAAFLSIFAAPAFLFFDPNQSFGQTQLNSERGTVPSPFRPSPFDRDRYQQAPRGFQLPVVARIPAAR